jgi:hypothetical protein
LQITRTATTYALLINCTTVSDPCTRRPYPSAERHTWFRDSLFTRGMDWRATPYARRACAGAVAKARAFAGMRSQSCEQLGVDRIELTFVPPRRRAQTDQPTRAPETRTLRSQASHRLAPRDGACHFFATTAFSAWMSSVCSATICFSRRFSSSRCFAFHQ